TIQADFVLPERFDLTYVAPDGERHRPVMLHRVILGSIERFIGILIEHYAGAFPTWLSPVQAVIMPITDKHADYAREVEAALKSAGIRVGFDGRNEKLGYKIREARIERTPYMVIIGDQEVEARAVSPRLRSGEEQKLIPLDDFIEMITGDARVPE
ncbi:MAG: threonine--tRNA ligase, partial [Deltaproteobacteria bacterium]